MCAEFVQQSLHAQPSGAFLTLLVERDSDDDGVHQIEFCHCCGDAAAAPLVTVFPVQPPRPPRTQATQHFTGMLTVRRIGNGDVELIDPFSQVGGAPQTIMSRQVRTVGLTHEQQSQFFRLCPRGTHRHRAWPGGRGGGSSPSTRRLLEEVLVHLHHLWKVHRQNSPNNFDIHNVVAMIYNVAGIF